jgi:proline iminopeptidase
MRAQRHSDRPAPHEGYIPVDHAALWYRDIGQGQPIIVLHGGPDFDCNYLLPEMDRLSDGFRLIYYDQRGRGRSARNVQPEDVSMQSDVDDIEQVRRHVALETVAILGHSWGGLLGMEYAIRYPDSVSHLILINTAFASYDDWVLFQQERRRRWATDIERMKRLSSTAVFQEGDPDTVAAYYRIHFSATLRQTEHLDAMVSRLRESFTKESILKSREIEERLMHDTCLRSDYDLLPKLQQLNIPTLVIHGEHDFIPVQCASRIAQAIPEAHFVLLPACGHFSYLECPDEVRHEIDAFFDRSGDLGSE